MIRLFRPCLILLLFSICFCPYQLQGQKTDKNDALVLYVSTNGDDSNPGTQTEPLASLVGARDAIRALKSNNDLNIPIEVRIAGGNYQMNEPLLLHPQDGGTNENPIMYKAQEGSSAVFSGGQKISGFKVNKNGIWEAQVKESSSYGWRFDQLYVNGKRAIMARTPNTGFVSISEIEEQVWIQGNGRAPDRAQQTLAFDSDDFSSIRNLPEDELEHFRFRTYHKWDFTLRFLDKIDRDNNRIYTSGKGMKPWNPIKKEGRVVFENYAAALDSPGEWYLDPKGKLYYFPRPGETPENSEVIAPVLENLISIEGEASQDKFVAHVSFEGLSFTHCHYQMPRTGSEPNQAAALINAAVMLKGANNISFSNCEISKTGQHALWFGKGCSRSLVRQCHLNDLGGGGIYLGDFKPQTGTEHTHHIQLDNNIIQSGGKEFPSAVGVWIGHSSDNEVSHNDIGNFFYTGVSVGWTWGYAESHAKRNKIIYNKIHHIGWDLLSDMAAVYTLGKSEGTVVSNNVIHHIHAYSYGGWGLYPDEGSSDIVMENNLVYKTKTGGFHQHYGQNNLIRNNIFAFAQMYQLQCTRVEKHRSFTFENNVVVFDKGVVLQGAWEKIDIEMDYNLYWNVVDDRYVFNDKSFESWKKSGHDSNSLIADPMFQDVKNHDFRIKSKRNTKRIGFIPFDLSKAGVYGSDAWKQKAILAPEVVKAFDEAVEQNMNQKIKR